ncbi:hypothetical protein GJ744_004811 [Endocarpon pusillum]|uniref:Uncharacterized protein n=1 Tax=Endocarpon pusillum TaxID=364733 RepID=A0A8H7A5C1_9EURO|nr:hypothetical protein GJ744_004811 [Endocarpon pusillum]
MSVSEKSPSPRISFDEDDKRPYVASYVQKPIFHVGDKVYLLISGGSREGPYTIASVPATGKCTLSLDNGQAVKNGAEIDMDHVESA